MRLSPRRRAPAVLGSTSVYRRELLSRLRLPFTVEPPHVDETPLPGERPPSWRAGWPRPRPRGGARASRRVVIGSDQVADLDGEPLGKPGNHANALASCGA
jgi:septum formation protein